MTTKRTISKVLQCEEFSDQYLYKCKEEHFYHEDTLKLYHLSQTTKYKLTPDLFIEMADTLELETEPDFPKLQKAMLKFNLMLLVYYISNRKHLYDCCERYTMDVLDKDNFSHVEMNFYIELRKHSLRSELQELRVLRGDDGAIKAEELETILRKHFPSKFEYALISPEHPSEQEERAIEKAKQAYEDFKNKNVDEIIESFSKEAMNDDLIKLIHHMEQNVFSNNARTEANSRTQIPSTNTREDIEEVDEEVSITGENEIDELEESDDGIDEYEAGTDYYGANEEFAIMNNEVTAIVVNSDDDSGDLFQPEEEELEATDMAHTEVNSSEEEVEAHAVVVNERGADSSDVDVDYSDIIMDQGSDLEEHITQENSVITESNDTEHEEPVSLVASSDEVEQHIMETEEENTPIEPPRHTPTDNLRIESGESGSTNDTNNVPSISTTTERPNKRHKPDSHGGQSSRSEAQQSPESSTTSSVKQPSIPSQRREIMRSSPVQRASDDDEYIRQLNIEAQNLEYADGQKRYTKSQATGSVQRFRSRAKPWTEDEVDALKAGLRKWQGPKWTLIIKAANGRLLDRTGVQCKDKARTEIAKLERLGITNIDDFGDWKWAKAPFNLD